MIHTYEFRILMHAPSAEEDPRDFPPIVACKRTLDGSLDVPLSMPEWKQLRQGRKIIRELLGDEIVLFHQKRREHGTCSRIKWKALS